MTKKLFSAAALLTALLCLLLFAACDTESGRETPAETPTEARTAPDTPADDTMPDPVMTATDTEPETAPATQSDESVTEPETQPATEPETQPATEPETQPASPSDVIAKLTGASDEVGIYTIVITLSDKAADKGVVEMTYYGAKGTPQEESVVNVFRIEYEKDDAGTYEIDTFYDGETYQNQHGKDVVKVNNTFGATIRAGRVVITYTPDGGDTVEIYAADAEQFRGS